MLLACMFVCLLAHYPEGVVTAYLFFKKSPWCYYIFLRNEILLILREKTELYRPEI